MEAFGIELGIGVGIRANKHGAWANLDGVRT